MRTHFRTWGAPMWFGQYTNFKRIPVLDPNFAGARAEADRWKGTGYKLFMGNCMDETYQVLLRYGTRGMGSPSSLQNIAPKAWFYWSVPGQNFVI